MKQKAMMITEEMLGRGPQIPRVQGASQPAQPMAQGCRAKLQS